MTHLDGLAAVCAAFEAQMPSPAGVSAAAAAAAIGASVVAMTGDGSPSWDEAEVTARQAREARDRLLDLAEEDVRAFDAVLRASREATGLGDALVWATRVPLEVAERASEVASLARAAVESARRPLRPDAAAAASLAETASRVALSVVDVNLGHPRFPLDAAEAMRSDAQGVAAALSRLVA